MIKKILKKSLSVRQYDFIKNLYRFIFPCRRHQVYSGTFFEGVYEHATDVPFSPKRLVWDSPEWFATTKHMSELRFCEGSGEHQPVSRHLAALCSYFRARESDEYVIYDIGGGLGDNFFEINPLFVRMNTHVHGYNIIETVGNVLLGKTQSKLPNYVFFSDKFDPAERGTQKNIVIICGTLQYVFDWREFVKSILRENIDAVYITRTLFHDRLSFFSLQHVIPGVGPYVGKDIGQCVAAVINQVELSVIFREAGFTLLLDDYLGEYCKDAMRFDAPYNETYYSSLLFVR